MMSRSFPNEAARTARTTGGGVRGFRAALPVLAVLLLTVGVGCSPRPLVRTLPRSINSVYVPMFESRAFEPGLEELATHYTVDRFLVDGRVRPVSRGAADLVISGTLLRWEERVSQLSSDDFELVREVQVTARVFAFAPEDTLKRDPIYVWDGITASGSFLVDPRFIGEVSPDDSKRILMEELGKQVVNAVLETTPKTGAAAGKLDDRLEDPGARYTPMESLRDRRYRTRGAAPLRFAY